MLLCPELAILPMSFRHHPDAERHYTVERNIGIGVDSRGRIAYIGSAHEAPPAFSKKLVRMPGRILLPGLVNAHSHAHQRLLRGRTQYAATKLDIEDNFWSWRQQMYARTQKLDPDGLYICARQLFIEMLLNGITTVGEFHYLHHQINGKPYHNPAAMSLAIAHAAIDAGIRLCLLRTFYFRGGFVKNMDPHQQRFCDGSLERGWHYMEDTVRALRDLHNPLLAWGIAAHSIRAVDVDDMVAMKTCAAHLPMHIHISEQQQEVDDCRTHYGTTPPTLLGRRGVLDSMTTLIHATHVQGREAEAIGALGAKICVCPSTEADLGDGLGPISDFRQHDITLSLGTDGHTLSSIMEEARRLEMHERLRLQRRNTLVTKHDGLTHVADIAFKAATEGGASCLDLNVGSIKKGAWADLIAMDLNDPQLVGINDSALLAGIVFSSDRSAITDVIVGGEFVVEQREHLEAASSAHEYKIMSERLS